MVQDINVYDGRAEPVGHRLVDFMASLDCLLLLLFSLVCCKA